MNDDIKINGISHKDVYINGIPHKAAWLNGRCIWEKKPQVKVQAISFKFSGSITGKPSSKMFFYMLMANPWHTTKENYLTQQINNVGLGIKNITFFTIPGNNPSSEGRFGYALVIDCLELQQAVSSWGSGVEIAGINLNNLTKTDTATNGIYLKEPYPISNNIFNSENNNKIFIFSQSSKKEVSYVIDDKTYQIGFTDNFFEDGSFYVVESSRGNVEIDFKNPSQGTLKSFFEDMKNKYNAIDIIN